MVAVLVQVTSMTDSFVCSLCGGQVSPRSEPGRLREYRRGVPKLPIPAEIAIPTCSACGELYFDQELSAKLEQLMLPAFLAWQRDHLGRLVSELQRRHGATKRQVAGICGVTPSYLSHLLAGTEKSSPTLQRLVEAFVAKPSEFARHMRGEAFKSMAEQYFFVAPARLAGSFDYDWTGPGWEKEAANDNTVTPSPTREIAV